MLCRIQKNSLQFDPDDVIDLIGEDFDVDDAEDEEDELDEIDVPLEHVNNFWNSTIKWTNVDLFFLLDRAKVNVNNVGKESLRVKKTDLCPVMQYLNM